MDAKQMMAEPFATIIESGHFYAKIKATAKGFGNLEVGTKLYTRPSPDAGRLPVATVKESNAGPYLFVHGIEVYSWLGTKYNDHAHELANKINEAAALEPK